MTQAEGARARAISAVVYELDDNATDVGAFLRVASDELAILSDPRSAREMYDCLGNIAAAAVAAMVGLELEGL